MAVLELGFKKDQTLRPSKVLGEAFAEGPSHFYTAVAEHIAMGVGRLSQKHEKIKDGTIPLADSRRYSPSVGDFRRLRCHGYKTWG